MQVRTSKCERSAWDMVQDDVQELRSENERLKTELSKAASAGTGLQTCIGCIDMLMF